MNELESLIKNCQKGKSKALEQVYREYSPKLFAVCLRYSDDYAHAQDLLQDGFVKIFKSIKSFKFKGSFEGWMSRIMVNTALEAYRKAKKMPFDQLHINAHDEPIEEQDDISTVNIPIDALFNMIHNLPDRYRLVFSLYVLDSYRHNEIAYELNISVGTSKSNLSRARAILQKNVEQYLKENEGRLRIC